MAAATLAETVMGGSEMTHRTASSTPEFIRGTSRQTMISTIIMMEGKETAAIIIIAMAAAAGAAVTGIMADGTAATATVADMTAEDSAAETPAVVAVMAVAVAVATE